MLFCLFFVVVDSNLQIVDRLCEQRIDLVMRAVVIILAAFAVHAGTFILLLPYVITLLAAALSDCDPLQPRCGLPFPNNFWLRPNATTGKPNVQFGINTLPKSADGKPINPVRVRVFCIVHSFLSAGRMERPGRLQSCDAHLRVLRQGRTEIAAVVLGLSFFAFVFTPSQSIDSSLNRTSHSALIDTVTGAFRCIGVVADIAVCQAKSCRIGLSLITSGQALRRSF